jgi:hypothetical protein
MILLNSPAAGPVFAKLSRNSPDEPLTPRIWYIQLTRKTIAPRTISGEPESNLSQRKIL